ncbi:acyl-CoA dehydrogenase family protein [Streptomyces sp. NPDC048527]|uniref:acyl-CoA dehydrogenase family protein n=1 Tax=Streptomyces sp. NPDC048527 TaxID=3365568 RepID=UPI003720E399
MEWVYSEEQEELRSTVRRFLRDKVPGEEVRRVMETELGHDPAVWRQMADQIGLQGLAVPEEYGGAGFGLVELSVVLEEMGRTLLPAPYFASVALAANVLLTSGDEAAKKDLLPGIASGDTIATLALAEDGGSWDPGAVRMTARREGERYLLTGHKNFVLDGHIADLVLVVARTDAGLSLFAVDGDLLGLSRTPLTTLDATRRQARLVFDALPGRLIGTDGGAEPGLVKALDIAAALLACEQMGGAQHCLESAVEHAKERVQFGRVIGSFQAVKHKLADMFVDIELARSAAQYAVWQVAEDTDEAGAAAGVAKAYCSLAYWNTVVETVEAHGGIAFTWEHDTHLYYKRAKSTQVLLGDPVHHRELIAQRVGFAEPAV